MGELDEDVKVTKREFPGLVVLAILGAGLVQALVIQLTQRVLNLPEAISFALGFLALFACLAPVIRTLSRSEGGKAPAAGRLFGAAVLGSIVAGVTFWLLR